MDKALSLKGILNHMLKRTPDQLEDINLCYITGVPIEVGALDKDMYDINEKTGELMDRDTPPDGYDPTEDQDFYSDLPKGDKDNPEHNKYNIWGHKIEEDVFDDDDDDDDDFYMYPRFKSRSIAPENPKTPTPNNAWLGYNRSTSFKEKDIVTKTKQKVNELKSNRIQNILNAMLESLDNNQFMKAVTPEKFVEKMNENHDLKIDSVRDYMEESLKPFCKHITNTEDYVLASNTDKPKYIIVAHIDTVKNDSRGYSYSSSSPLTEEFQPFWDFDGFLTKSNKKSAISKRNSSKSIFMGIKDEEEEKDTTYSGAIETKLEGRYISGMFDNLVNANGILLLIENKLIDMNKVAVLYTTGEERGCIGCGRFLKQYPDFDVEGIINLDVTEEGNDLTCLSFEHITNPKSVGFIDNFLQENPSLYLHTNIMEGGVMDDGKEIKNHLQNKDNKNIISFSYCLKLSGGNMHGESKIIVPRVFVFFESLRKMLS